MVVNATALRAYAIILEVKRYGTRTACPWSVWNRPAIEMAARTTRPLMVASRSPLRPCTCITARRHGDGGQRNCTASLRDQIRGQAIQHTHCVVQVVGMAMVHRSLPIPFAQARICIDSATVTRHAARMMAQAVAARKQRYKHRNRT